MPVGRVILKSISDSHKLPKLKTDGARLLYTWLLTHLDVNGCFSGDPQVIKGKVFTRLNKSIKAVENYLNDMEENKLIIRYQVNGDIFLNVPDFVEKQPSLRPEREGQTNIPLPSKDLLKKTPEHLINENEYFKKDIIPVYLIKQVSERDKGICQICGKAGIEDGHFKHFIIEKEKDIAGREIAFEIDHIIPEYLGGKTILENLRLVCRKCNRQRGFKLTPAELQQYSGGTPTQFKLSKVKLSKDNISKEKTVYAEFVSMTLEEYQKLIDKYGEANTKRFIEKLSIWKIANGKEKIKGSDYGKILNWVVDAVIGADKKKELEDKYKLGIQKAKEWEAIKEKPTDVIPDNIKKQLDKILK